MREVIVSWCALIRAKAGCWHTMLCSNWLKHSSFIYCFAHPSKISKNNKKFNSLSPDIVTNCCIYKDIKFTRLLILINLALYAEPNLLPARRCRTISNEKPNNKAQELSENDLKFSNVKTYLHITVMLKTLSKDLKRFPRVVQTIFVLSTSGFLHRIVPKNTYILGSETAFNCYLQGP